jgi:F0F1-type ATP synthase membrane subunit c/vacuolar-type H+-ATPase subunit K
MLSASSHSPGDTTPSIVGVIAAGLTGIAALVVIGMVNKVKTIVRKKKPENGIFEKMFFLFILIPPFFYRK